MARFSRESEAQSKDERVSPSAYPPVLALRFGLAMDCATADHFFERSKDATMADRTPRGRAGERHEQEDHLVARHRAGVGDVDFDVDDPAVGDVAARHLQVRIGERAVAEALGTALLLAAVAGSGINELRSCPCTPVQGG